MALEPWLEADRCARLLYGDAFWERLLKEIARLKLDPKIEWLVYKNYHYRMAYEILMMCSRVARACGIDLPRLIRENSKEPLTET